MRARLGCGVATLPPAVSRPKRGDLIRAPSASCLKNGRLLRRRSPAGDERATDAGLAEARRGERGQTYFRCLLTSLVISNMLTVALPPKTGLSAASALIMRRFFVSCSPFFLM